MTHHSARAIVLATVVLLSATGCASTPAPAPSTPSGPKEYGSVLELRDAYVEAGGECSAWNPSNVVTLAAESADCSSSTVLMTFVGEDDRDELIDVRRGLGGDISLLVGPNWIVNSNDIENVQKGLGGTLLVK